MVLSTFIARFPDGLALAASTEEGEVESSLAEAKAQTKVVLRRLNQNSERACSIEAGKYSIHYLISAPETFIAITAHAYPRKLAFSYLDELSKEFQRSNGESEVLRTVRPYAFRGFDTFISKTTRMYQDSRTAEAASLLPDMPGTPDVTGGPSGTKGNMDRLNEDLRDVTKIMTANITEILERGSSLERMSDLSSSLRNESKKYRKAAGRINLEALIRKWAPVGGIGFFFILFMWWRFF